MATNWRGLIIGSVLSLALTALITWLLLNDRDRAHEPDSAARAAMTPASKVTKPDFSGTWKLQSTETSEVFTYEHREPALRVIMRLGGDALGQRTLDFSGRIDRQEHRQTVEGQPASLLAWWEGDELLLEIKREIPGGTVNSRRRMKLSADGKTITAQRTILSPGPERGWPEIWERQAGVELGGAAATAADLLRQVGEKYASLKTFSASGKVVSELTLSPGAAARTNATTFSLNLARPEFYRVMWTNRTGWGAAWSAGDGHRVLPFVGTAVSAKAIALLNREQATASASSSLGTARMVPGLFFKDEPLNELKSLTNAPLHLQAEGIVEGEACHVIVSESPTHKRTLWIRKQDLLLKQYRTEPGADYGKGPVRTVTTSDEDLGKILKSTGQEASPEAVNKLRQQMNEGKVTAGSGRIIFTHTYQAIKVNGLMIKEDFEVAVPAGSAGAAP